jgi:hypothetical protein
MMNISDKICRETQNTLFNFSSIILRLRTKAPWFVTNQTLHQDLCIEEVGNVFREKAVAHHKTLSKHPNTPIGPLTDRPKGSCSPQNTV